MLHSAGTSLCLCPPPPLCPLARTQTRGPGGNVPGPASRWDGSTTLRGLARAESVCLLATGGKCLLHHRDLAFYSVSYK